MVTNFTLFKMYFVVWEDGSLVRTIAALPEHSSLIPTPSDRHEYR